LTPHRTLTPDAYVDLAQVDLAIMWLWGGERPTANDAGRVGRGCYYQWLLGQNLNL